MYNELREDSGLQDKAEALRVKADQCRRLAKTITDRQTVEGLTALADEYERAAYPINA